MVIGSVMEVGMGEKHWSLESDIDLRTRISFDFLAQIEEKMDENGWSRADMASAMGVTKGRISQVFNNPGNLTLKTMMRMAVAVGSFVSVVAYSQGGEGHEAGPVISCVFEACWEKMNKPVTKLDLDGVVFQRAIE